MMCRTELKFCRYFITTSRDMTARLYTLHPIEGFKPKSFGGHRDVVLRAFFSEDEKTVSEATSSKAENHRFTRYLVMGLSSSGKRRKRQPKMIRTLKGKSSTDPQPPPLPSIILSPTLDGAFPVDITSINPALGSSAQFFIPNLLFLSLALARASLVYGRCQISPLSTLCRYPTRRYRRSPSIRQANGSHSGQPSSVSFLFGSGKARVTCSSSRAITST